MSTKRSFHTEDSIRAALDAAELGTWTLDPVTKLFTSDNRFKQIVGISITGLNTREVLLKIHSKDRDRAEQALKPSIRLKDPLPFEIECRVIHPDGSLHSVLAKGKATFSTVNGKRKLAVFAGTVTDITKHKLVQTLLLAQKQILDLADDGASIKEVMKFVARSLYEYYGGQSRTSLFMLEPDGLHLRFIVGVDLPKEYIRGVDNFEVGLQSPLYGKAAFTGQPEIVVDVKKDPLWVPFLDLAKKHSIRAIWSIPLRTMRGKVLGAVAVYHKAPRAPQPFELEAMKLLSQTAAIVIERNDESEQREQAETSLRDSEIKYRRLFEAAKDGILILDVSSTKITDANPFMSKLLDYSHDEIIGKELWQLGFFEDKKANQAAMVELKKKKYIRYEDLPLKTKTRRQIDVEFVSNVYREGGQLVIQCNIRDITERKLAEREVIESKRQAQVAKENLHSLFLHAPAIVAMISGPDLIFDMANLPYRQMVGLHRQLDGVSLFTAFPDMDSRLLEIVRNVATKGERFMANEFPMLLDWDGNNKPYTKYINLVYEPILESDGKPNGLMCFGHDITELVVNRKKLEEASSSKDEFISIASHELKTPITSIKAYTQILEQRFKKSNDGQSAEMVGKMDIQIDKLSCLIEDLLDVTKIDSGKMGLRKTFFDFNKCITDIIENMQLTTTRHKISKNLARLKHIYGDKDRLSQVFVNLISNAIKYSPDTKRIEVKTKTKDDILTLSIRDFGVGLSVKDSKKIFERLYRVKGPSHIYPGLGLGLYIASKIIKQHDGEIWVESKKGKGATFYVTLPIKKN